MEVGLGVFSESLPDIVRNTKVLCDHLCALGFFASRSNGMQTSPWHCLKFTHLLIF